MTAKTIKRPTLGLALLPIVLTLGVLGIQLFYFKDFTDLFPDKGPRDVKKILTKLVNEEVLEFWSSGSTTMYGLKGAGKQSHAEGED